MKKFKKIIAWCLLILLPLVMVIMTYILLGVHISLEIFYKILQAYVIAIAITVATAAIVKGIFEIMD